MADRHPEYKLLDDHHYTHGERVWILKKDEICRYSEDSDNYLFDERGGCAPFVNARDVETSPEVFAPVNYFILQGEADNLDSFFNYHKPEFAGYEWFWTVPKIARLGDTAFIYLCAPESRIAGRVRVTGEPFFNHGEMFAEKIMKDKWCAEISFEAYYEPRGELSFKGLKSLFLQDWNWLAFPRGNTKLPPAIWKPFFEMTLYRERIS